MNESVYKTWLRRAYGIALGSPDLSTQNGAIVLNKVGNWAGAGWNTLPDRVEITPERLERPLKYTWTEHAERNAIYHAAKLGNSTDGGTMVVPWFACAECGRAIIQAGIVKVVGHGKMFADTPDRWKDSISEAFIMFKEAGVETLLIDGDLGQCDPIRFNEALWTP